MYRYKGLSASFYVNRRSAFAEKMTVSSAAFLCSNDVKHTNADDVMGFAQNNDLFYLSGIDQPETLLFVCPNAQRESDQEILFIRETNEEKQLWDGASLTKEQASAISGIKRVEWTSELAKILDGCLFDTDEIYLCHNEHIKRVTTSQETQSDRWIKWFKEKYPLHKYNRVTRITKELRPTKEEEEVQQIQEAANIGAAAFKRALNHVKAGMKEYEIEAELTYWIIKSGGTRHAFKPIVGSGENACVLHYNTNHDTINEGEMILLDFGVCYGNYNSDTTRCFPVSGKFSPRQRQVYEAVLHCLKEGAKLLKPGVLHSDYEENMAKLVEEQLIQLGLLSPEDIKNQDPNYPAYKNYFMHGTAHYLGLDVHDIGRYNRRFEEGMVLTCEPGIYIRDEKIGCRLENDYLITSDGHKNLTEEMPIEVDEIEAFMQSTNN